jgi:hypothetical protein
MVGRRAMTEAYRFWKTFSKTFDIKLSPAETCPVARGALTSAPLNEEKVSRE